MILAKENWDDAMICSALQGQGFVAVNDALTSEFWGELRGSLLNHWGWRYRNWIDDHLTNRSVMTDPQVLRLVDALRRQLPLTLGDMKHVDIWSILFNEGKRLGPHADHGDLSMVLWLTPTVLLEPPVDRGGLILHSTTRTQDQLYSQYANVDWAAAHVAQSTHSSQVITYTPNTAIFFRGDIFHETGEDRFESDELEKMRHSLTLVFMRDAEPHHATLTL